MGTRTFICLDVPDADRGRIGGVQATLKEYGARISWANAHGVHISLAFLGDLSDAEVASASSAAQHAAGRTPQFFLRIEGSGGFPSLSRPRVLWAGVNGDLEPLHALHQGLWSELVGLGFPRDTKAFHPHVTLGRVKDPRDRALPAVTGALEGLDLSGDPFVVAEIIVMKSELLPGGSRYTPLARFALGPA